MARLSVKKWQGFPVQFKCREINSNFEALVESVETIYANKKGFIRNNCEINHRKCTFSCILSRLLVEVMPNNFP